MTSCEFAQRVNIAFWQAQTAAAQPGKTPNDAAIVVKSPVTRQTYTMDCVPQSNKQEVICTGGTGASVVITPASERATVEHTVPCPQPEIPATNGQATCPEAAIFPQGPS